VGIIRPYRNKVFLSSSCFAFSHTHTNTLTN
jgi:hypothetical protein